MDLEKRLNMNERKGEFLVGLALALRASSLLFGKIAMRTMGPYLTIAIRFTIAFILIAFLFRKSLHKVNLRTLWHCALIGFFFFLAMVFEMFGLQTTPSSVTAFLEGSVVVIVPAIACIMQRKLPDNWQYLSLVDVEILKEDISPLLAKSQSDEGAKRFDVLVLTVELSQVNDQVKGKRSIRNIIAIAQALKEKCVIPQIQEKMETIDMVLGEVFWENLTMDGLERVRIELRELVKFIFGEQRRQFEVDIEDEVTDQGVAEEMASFTTYRQRVLEYLAENRNLPVLQKIINIEPLTDADIRELERIMWNELVRAFNLEITVDEACDNIMARLGQ